MKCTRNVILDTNPPHLLLQSHLRKTVCQTEMLREQAIQIAATLFTKFEWRDKKLLCVFCNQLRKNYDFDSASSLPLKEKWSILKKKDGYYKCLKDVSLSARLQNRNNHGETTCNYYM